MEKDSWFKDEVIKLGVKSALSADVLEEILMEIVNENEFEVLELDGGDSVLVGHEKD